MKSPETIPYSIKRNRRSKGIRIVVRCDAVVVTAPHRLSERIIQRFVDSRMEWIKKTLHALQKRKSPWIIPDDLKSDTFHACQARAKQLVRDRVKFYNQFYNFDFARISVKNTQSRWGSCSSQKNLNFHYRLLFLPSELADYVVVHELCHLQEMNHSKRFWQLIAQTMPDFPARVRELRKYDVSM